MHADTDGAVIKTGQLALSWRRRLPSVAQRNSQKVSRRDGGLRDAINDIFSAATEASAFTQLTRCILGGNFSPHSVHSRRMDAAYC